MAGKVVQMHPLWQLVMYFCIHIILCKSIKGLYSSGMQQQQPGTVTHSHISSLLISRCLSRPRVASRYSVQTPTYFKQLASYENNYVCHKCIYVTGNGRGNSKILGHAAT